MTQGSMENWRSWIEDCRRLEKPVVPMLPEPWFSVEYVCGSFLMIEGVDAFVRKCKEAGVPILRVNRHPLVRFSDLEKLGIE